MVSGKYDARLSLKNTQVGRPCPVAAAVVGEQRGGEPLQHSGTRPGEASRGSHGGEGRHARGGGAAEAALRLIVLQVAQLALDAW